MSFPHMTLHHCTWLQKRGYTEIVELLIRNGFDIEALSGLRLTPLGEAAARGKSDVVRLLLSNNCNKERKSASDGFTALYWAAYGGHAEVVKHLLAAGCDTEAQNTNYHTPLQIGLIWRNQNVAKFFLNIHLMGGQLKNPQHC